VGNNAKSPPRARASKATVDGSGGGPRRTGGLVDAPVAGVPTEPAARPQNPAQCQPEGPRCTVWGEPVTEFRALIDGHAGTIITDKGTWVFTRVFFADGQFDLGDGRGRTVAGQRVIGAEVNGIGLTVHMTDYKAFIPLQSLKLSWKAPASPI
jgi:hypothetical protein